ncbi:MAG: DEAD/DEAH box helicase [Caulobacterales bacterium]
MLPPKAVPPVLGEALSKRGYTTLTGVQTAVLAPELSDLDLIVSAQTGSGKTVAFGLAMAKGLLAGAERFDRPADPLALVIAPTRELALQVKGELGWLYGPAGAVVVSCVGGMDPRDERRALERGAHIIVGTPGRLADHIRRNALVLESVRALVLDEADEMLSLGFREELEFILGAAPRSRRTLMFSATMARGIEPLARTFMRDAQRVNTVGEHSAHQDISYRALVAAASDTENAIFNVLRFYDTTALVFCGTREAVNRMTSRLANRGMSVVALSGELSQAERTHALQALRDRRARVCVATDVAARGIDLPELDLVIHADLPKGHEALLHRSGRTGRAGRKGVSIVIVPDRARRRAERLFDVAKVRPEWGLPPSADDVVRRDDERLLRDDLLTDAPDPSEQRLIEALLQAHAPSALAAGFLRLRRKGMAAPEDLETVSSEKSARSAREPSSRDSFGPSTWVRLSIGRSKGAEPRWILPLLCRSAGLTKRDIGAIRIQPHETHVQLADGAVEGFFAALGPDGMVEKSIRASLLGETQQDEPSWQPERQTHKSPPAIEQPPKVQRLRPKNKLKPLPNSARPAHPKAKARPPKPRKGKS